MDYIEDIYKTDTEIPKLIVVMEGAKKFITEISDGQSIIFCSDKTREIIIADKKENEPIEILKITDMDYTDLKDNFKEYAISYDLPKLIHARKINQKNVGVSVGNRDEKHIFSIILRENESHRFLFEIRKRFPEKIVPYIKEKEQVKN